MLEVLEGKDVNQLSAEDIENNFQEQLRALRQSDDEDDDDEEEEEVEHDPKFQTKTRPPIPPMSSTTGPITALAPYKPPAAQKDSIFETSTFVSPWTSSSAPKALTYQPKSNPAYQQMQGYMERRRQHELELIKQQVPLHPITMTQP